MDGASAVARTHIVKQGECLSSIARHYGLPTWRKIYNHPDNASFKQSHPNPNVIHPGDRLVIPEIDNKRESVPTETRHRFRYLIEQTVVRLVFRDEDGEPFADLPYELQIEDTLYEGTTDSEGRITEVVQIEAETGEVTIWFDAERQGDSFTWPIELGHLDPVEETEGVQARLNNLGFEGGSIDGDIGPVTEQAVKEFQQKNDLPVSGKPDSETCAKLIEKHGS